MKLIVTVATIIYKGELLLEDLEAVRFHTWYVFRVEWCLAPIRVRHQLLIGRMELLFLAGLLLLKLLLLLEELLLLVEGGLNLILLNKILLKLSMETSGVFLQVQSMRHIRGLLMLIHWSTVLYILIHEVLKFLAVHIVVLVLFVRRWGQFHDFFTLSTAESSVLLRNIRDVVCWREIGLNHHILILEIVLFFRDLLRVFCLLLMNIFGLSLFALHELIVLGLVMVTFFVHFLLLLLLQRLA